jgi:SAM-dependent methyltransferase
VRVLSSLEENVYNSGERIIPGITNPLEELVRHRSSYVFFRRIIEFDLKTMDEPKPVRIIDLGCGVGHGCKTLSKIPNAQIVGIDYSPESIEYARSHYAKKNITYRVSDLVEYISKMPEFDYVVSRNVFEHIPNGLQLALRARWRFRLMFDVPYDERPGRNPHHVLFNIREESFSTFPEAELFYQDLAGVVYDVAHKPPEPNIIFCVCNRLNLVKIGESDISFPVPPWQPKSSSFYKAHDQIHLLLRRVLHKMKRTLRVRNSLD